MWKRQHIDSCLGNTGGPLICDNLQYGILSWTPECSVNEPLIWTRVEYYLDWINTVIRTENDRESFDYNDSFRVDDLIQNPNFFDIVLSENPKVLIKQEDDKFEDPSLEEAESIHKEKMESQINLMEIMDEHSDQVETTSINELEQKTQFKQTKKKKLFTYNTYINLSNKFRARFLLLFLCFAIKIILGYTFLSKISLNLKLKMLIFDIGFFSKLVRFRVLEEKKKNMTLANMTHLMVLVSISNTKRKLGLVLELE